MRRHSVPPQRASMLLLPNLWLVVASLPDKTDTTHKKNLRQACGGAAAALAALAALVPASPTRRVALCRNPQGQSEASQYPRPLDCHSRCW